MDRSIRDHLLSIGEMAEANHVSIATLRLYDRMGLLKPSYRDAESNYRYYDIRQNLPAGYHPLPDRISA